jgi:hypothetical protein
MIQPMKRQNAKRTYTPMTPIADHWPMAFDCRFHIFSVAFNEYCGPALVVMVTNTVRKWSFEEIVGDIDDVIDGTVVTEVGLAESVDTDRSVDVESAVVDVGPAMVGAEFAKLIKLMVYLARIC